MRLGFAKSVYIGYPLKGLSLPQIRIDSPDVGVNVGPIYINGIPVDVDVDVSC
jgi:hypothetical protein